MRPMSAGSVHSHSQTPSAQAQPRRASGRKTPAPVTPSISLIGSNLSQPVRSVSNTARRPSSAVKSSRCFASVTVSPVLPKSDHEPDNVNTCLWQQDPLGPEASSVRDVESIYHVIVARKDAEDAAQQLARRISHFRAQEDRVLREMGTMRTHLETSLKKLQKKPNFSADIPAVASRLMQQNVAVSGCQGVVKQEASSTPSGYYKRPLKAPRIREQLEFLANQKRALELHKHDVARQQKERRKVAIAEQKVREAEQEHKRRCRKDRIRAEEQQAKEQRIEKQHHLREAATKNHYERLMAEKQRQHEALNLITEMEEEERNVRLRLEALYFHRQSIQQELRGSAPPHYGI